jgi:hypothetical protein
VIWSMNLRYGNRGGYALAITSNRVVGAPRSALFHYFERYVGPGSKATEEEHQQANQIFPEIVAAKDLEIPKDSVTKISWKKGGVFHKGHFLFNTTKGDFQIDTVSTNNTLSVVHTTNQILASLVDFAPDIFYDEKTGELFVKEATEWMQTHKKS